ncbi:geranylgeranyl pyrophosphate synthase [Bacteroidales bacterium 6E]|nr:geranylgeranyl pyrophosphate synthase [Bacteroidales bacterium 6E]
MTKKDTEILAVPDQAGIRLKMTRTARLVVKSKNIRPPVSFLQIMELAQQVILQGNYDRQFLEFAMVLCGNETWRQVVASTPYNRRLLLLPQCLKDEKNCQAAIDQLGLICAGCQSCSIDEILVQAESLGYNTLVAEGTTVAMQLVQEGSVDAIIGVTCMSVLRKSFPTVYQAAVPVIGIPLLFEGCANTDVDRHWIMREINQYEPSQEYPPLSLSVIRNEVRSWFNDHTLNTIFSGNGSQTNRMAISIMLHGGGRMRPILTIIAYKAYEPDPSEKLAENLAVIVECFHKASLIHDDIEDQDDYRYERETLHLTHGMASAINTGDYLIGKGYQLLSGLAMSTESLQQCFRLISEGHVALSIGQGDDILSSSHNEIPKTETLLQTYRLKTGSAIKVALLLGAVAGGAPAEEIAILEHFSDEMGIAYQIRDDIHEFREERDDRKFSDYPVMLSLLVEKVDQDTKRQFVSFISNNQWLDVHSLLENAQIPDAADKLLQTHVANAYRLLDQLNNFRMRLSLYSLMGKIF